MLSRVTASPTDTSCNSTPACTATGVLLGLVSRAEIVGEAELRKLDAEATALDKSESAVAPVVDDTRTGSTITSPTLLTSTPIPVEP